VRSFTDDRYFDDRGRIRQECVERDVRVIYTCSRCHSTREDYPGCNEGGTHYGCGGDWQKTGESYDAR
jgi:hypothetical protein